MKVSLNIRNRDFRETAKETGFYFRIQFRGEEAHIQKLKWDGKRFRAGPRKPMPVEIRK